MIVTIELGESVDRGDADTGFGVLGRLDQGGRERFRRRHKEARTSLVWPGADFSRFQAAARALATSGLAFAVLTSARRGFKPAQHARGVLELEQVFLVRFLEVELLDQPALGVDLDHLGLGGGRDHKLVRGSVDHDGDDPRLARRPR